MKYRHVAVLVSLAFAFAGAFTLGGGCDPCPKCSHPSPPSTHSSSGQGLIAIDTNHNIGYVPIYPFDHNGDSQIAVVNLKANRTATATATPTATSTPVGASAGEAVPAPEAALNIIKLISLTGTNGQNTVQPIACTFNPQTNKVFCEGREGDSSVNVYEIDANTQALINTIAGPAGLTQDGFFGGIIADPVNNTVAVAGTSSVAVMDSSTNPPSFVPNSFVDLSNVTGGTDSIALNFETDLLFVSSDGSLAVLELSQTPPAVHPFQNSEFGTTDGVSFDSLTNMLIITPEFQDLAFAFNFAEADLTTGSAPNVLVPGLGTTGPVGEGPGGQAVVNQTTHQSVVADEFGQNFRLIQLPATKITGPPDNNGQPGSGTRRDANSAFTIAASIIPKGEVDGAPTQLGIVGDPNSLSMDPVNNFAYLLADTFSEFHQWQGGPAGTTTALFLIRIDLSHPVFGGTTTGPVQWNPDQLIVQMPR